MSTVLNMIELRAGTVADLGIVDTIMSQAFDPRFGEAWTRGQCLGIMSMPGVWLVLAYLDGAPVGFALSRRIIDEAELLLLATAPAARRRGVGAALLRSVLISAREEGATHLHLEVREGNDATKLYSGAGFTRVGERRHYYRGSSGEAFHALTFSRNTV